MTDGMKYSISLALVIFLSQFLCLSLYTGSRLKSVFNLLASVMEPRQSYRYSSYLVISINTVRPDYRSIYALTSFPINAFSRACSGVVFPKENFGSALRVVWRLDWSSVQRATAGVIYETGTPASIFVLPVY